VAARNHHSDRNHLATDLDSTTAPSVVTVRALTDLCWWWHRRRASNWRWLLGCSVRRGAGRSVSCLRRPLQRAGRRRGLDRGLYTDSPIRRPAVGQRGHRSWLSWWSPAPPLWPATSLLRSSSRPWAARSGGGGVAGVRRWKRRRRVRRGVAGQQRPQLTAVPDNDGSAEGARSRTSGT
jgi:hypothetical protein